MTRSLLTRIGAQNGRASIRRFAERTAMSKTKPAQELVSPDLERIANALERQNDLSARQADIDFLQLDAIDQEHVEVLDRRRHAKHLKEFGTPPTPPLIGS